MEPMADEEPVLTRALFVLPMGCRWKICRILDVNLTGESAKLAMVEEVELGATIDAN